LSIVKYIEPQDPWFSRGQFNEQDTYGHYIKTLHPDEVNLRRLRWTNISLEPSDKLFRRLSKRYDYCSLHAYLREDVTLNRRAWLRIKFELKMIIAQLKGIDN